MATSAKAQLPQVRFRQVGEPKYVVHVLGEMAGYVPPGPLKYYGLTEQRASQLREFAEILRDELNA